MKLKLLPLFVLAVLTISAIFDSTAQTTQLRSSDCNSSGVVFSYDLYANTVANATSYRFRIDNGSSVVELTKSVRFFNFNEVSNALYNSVHSVQVAVELNNSGVFGAYGPVCTVTTAPFLAQLRTTDCGKVVLFFTSPVYANYIGGDSYDFEVTNLTTSQTEVVTKTTRLFRLSDLTSPTYETQYLIRVRVVINGVQQPYGNTCSIFIDTDPTLPRIRASYCGTTHELLAYEYFRSTFIPDATLYEFRINDGINSFTFQTATDSARFVDFVALPTINYQYNTTYDIDVRAFVNSAWTDFGPTCQISTTEYPYAEVMTQCGSTLASFSTPISFHAVFSAEEYEFEITNLSTMNVDFIQKDFATFGGNFRRFSLNELPDFGYGIEYSVRARVFWGGVWHPFGNACTVSAPDPITELRPADCGKTVSVMSEDLYATEVTGATGYRFEVTNTSTLDVEVIEKGTRFFNLNELTSPEFNTTYSVSVAVEYESVWQPFGSVCNVNSPNPVLARLRTPDCGRTLLLMNQPVYANFTDADEYRFEVTNLTTMIQEIIVKTTRDFRLTELASPQVSTEYSIRISVDRLGDVLPYGPACSIFSSASMLMPFEDDVLLAMSPDQLDEFMKNYDLENTSVSYDFMSTYPNPFGNEGFTIQLDDVNLGDIVSLTIVDMTGKIVYTQDARWEEMTNTRFGSELETGIYSIILRNNEQVLTNKLIKK